jgi:hypothetical protein
MANPFKILKQITKNLSVADVIAVAKKGPKKTAKFFQIVFWAPKIFLKYFFLWFCIENRLNKNK